MGGAVHLSTRFEMIRRIPRQAWEVLAEARCRLSIQQAYYCWLQVSAVAVVVSG